MKIDDFLRDRSEYTAPETEKKEETTQINCVKFLHREYPEVKFTPTSFENIAKYANNLQSAINKAYTLGHTKGSQDLWLIFPNTKDWKYKVMLLELKRPGTKIWNRQGELKTKHLKDQARQIQETREIGHYSDFVIGSNAFKHIIYHSNRLCDISPPVILP